jgi:hypothetical protein
VRGGEVWRWWCRNNCKWRWSTPTSVHRVLVHRAGGGKAPSRHVGTIYTSPKPRNGLCLEYTAQYTADLINGPYTGS